MKLNIAPTKSNLLAMKEQLSSAENGYDLLEQKREILVMELMHMAERVRILETKIDKATQTSYAALKRVLMKVGGDRIEQISRAVRYDFRIEEKPVTIGGMKFSSIVMNPPQKQLFYSALGTFSSCDEVICDFFDLLTLLTEMASIRTIVWRLAGEVKKTQRRVNALDKMVIPQTRETKKYIESQLEERERDNTFVLKALKNKKNSQGENKC